MSRLSPIYIERLEKLLEEVFSGDGPHNVMLAKILTEGLGIEPEQVFTTDTTADHLQAIDAAVNALEGAVNSQGVKLNKRQRKHLERLQQRLHALQEAL